MEPTLDWSEQSPWARGWRRLLFPGVFLVYLLGTAGGIADYTDGLASAVGLAILVAFGACYMAALARRFGGPQAGFWPLYWAMVVLVAAELPFAHEAGLPMLTYVVVLSISTLGNRATPVVGACVMAGVVVPVLVPSWHQGLSASNGFSIGIVGLVMFGFFNVMRANRHLTEARAEVAQLATEGERSRIARDLHDLLGHSLTTITVKAALARRLAESDPERAIREIGEVEELARRSLADVRATVSGYREVTLTGELASGRELLRAAGVTAELPPTTEVVRSDHHELFGWVVREALTNVVRHARATRCSVVLGADSVEIVDDGSGVAASPGNGLDGLRQRVESAGGRLETGPGPAGGWRLHVELPA